MNKVLLLVYLGFVLMFDLALAQDTSWLLGDWQIGGAETYQEDNNFIFSFQPNNVFVLWVTQNKETISEQGRWQLEGDKLLIATTTLESHNYSFSYDDTTLFLSGGYFATRPDLFGSEPMAFGKVTGLEIKSYNTALSGAFGSEAHSLLGEWFFEEDSTGLVLSFREGGRMVVMMMEGYDITQLEAGGWEINDAGLQVVSNILDNETFGFTLLESKTPSLVLTLGSGDDAKALTFERTIGQVVRLQPVGETSANPLDATLLEGLWFVGQWTSATMAPLTLNADNSYQFGEGDVPPGERGLWSLAGGEFRFISDNDQVLNLRVSKRSDSSFTLQNPDGVTGDELVLERVP